MPPLPSQSLADPFEPCRTMRLPKRASLCVLRVRPSSCSCRIRPAGDQPVAIDQLVEGVKDGEVFQTLLGVTGSGKTFTMANTIARLGRPAIVFAPNKTLAAQLYSGVPRVFPQERGRVLRQLLRLLPARGLCAAARSVHRERQRDQRAHRADAPLLAPRAFWSGATW